VKLAPNDLALRHQLAETYVRNQLGPRAIPHLQFIEQHGPPQERALAWQQIGAIHQTQGEQDLAIEAIEKALALTSPGNWLRLELGSQIIRLHQRYHRTAELEAKWKKFAEANPRDLGGRIHESRGLPARRRQRSAAPQRRRGSIVALRRLLHQRQHQRARRPHLPRARLVVLRRNLDRREQGRALVPDGKRGACRRLARAARLKKGTA